MIRFQCDKAPKLGTSDVCSQVFAGGASLPHCRVFPRCVEDPGKPKHSAFQLRHASTILSGWKMLPNWRAAFGKLYLPLRSLSAWRPERPELALSGAGGQGPPAPEDVGRKNTICCSYFPLIAWYLYTDFSLARSK